MAPAPIHHFDVYLSGILQAGGNRADLVKRVDSLYRVDRPDAAEFIAEGKRIRVRRGIDQDAAMKTILELQALGAVVEIEPHRSPEAALANLDEFPEVTPPPPDLPPGAIPPARELKDALVSLDGVGPVEENTIDREAPTASGGAAAYGESVTNPMVLETLDAPTNPFSPQPVVHHSQQITQVRDDARFAAPSLDSADFQIHLDVAAPAPAAAQVKPLAPEALEAEELRLCERHDLAEPCKECAREVAPIPGRIMRGELRRKPALRLGAGLVLGLLVGYLASTPFANRAERKVALVRAEADLDRYKNAPEALANAARLDARAEDLANSAALGSIAIWLLVGGVVVGGWFRAT